MFLNYPGDWLMHLGEAFRLHRLTEGSAGTLASRASDALGRELSLSTWGWPCSQGSRLPRSHTGAEEPPETDSRLPEGRTQAVSCVDRPHTGTPHTCCHGPSSVTAHLPSARGPQQALPLPATSCHHGGVLTSPLALNGVLALIMTTPVKTL